jgi:hypothetical protein
VAMSHRPQSKDVFPPFQFFSECMKKSNIKKDSLNLIFTSSAGKICYNEKA